jgi:hypothetical protein
MKFPDLKRSPVALLVVAVASVIVVLVFVTVQQSWAPAVSILSIVLGWLLKALSDFLTMDQRRQWEIEDEVRERTLKYYESKFADLSQLIADEIRGLTKRQWVANSGRLRIIEDEIGLTMALLLAAGSARPFVQAIADHELANAYTDATAQLVQLNELVRNINSGSFDTFDQVELRNRVQGEVAAYLSKLKDLQLVVERARIKALRGELTLEKKISD